MEIWGEDQSQVVYAYDLDGIRTQKVVENIAHNYVTQNGKVVRETIGTGTTAKVLDFVYDASGRPFALKYKNGTAAAQTYYYVLNLQGDVVALMTASRSIIAQYTYNVWGEVLSATNASGTAITNSGHIANLNPIRYRGYCYDSETGFYYLHSRYYDPVLYRFLNADVVFDHDVGIEGYNLLIYCGNNPVRRIDTSGRDSEDSIESIIDPYDMDEYGSSTSSGYVYGGSGDWSSTVSSYSSSGYYTMGTSSSSTTNTTSSSAGYTSYGGYNYFSMVMAEILFLNMPMMYIIMCSLIMAQHHRDIRVEEHFGIKEILSLKMEVHIENTMFIHMEKGSIEAGKGL